jgi:branched-chain amino acid transport system substrate-binding protein
MLLTSMACTPAPTASAPTASAPTAVVAAPSAAAAPTKPASSASPVVSPAASPVAATTSGGPIQIAFVGDLTGGDAVNGLGGQAGAKTAVKKINDAGGVAGHPIELRVFDTQTNPTTAEAVTREALAGAPAAASATITSGFSASTAPVVEAAGIPWVSTSYPTPGTDKVPFWFTTGPTSSEASDGVAVGAVNGLKGLLGGSLAGKTIAVEGVASTPAVDTHITVIQNLVKQNGGTVATPIRDPLTLSSWSSQAANLVASHPDGLVVIHTEPAATVVAKAAELAGFDGPIVSTEGANSDTMLKTVNLPNLYVVRETVAPAAGSNMLKNATAAGVSITDMNNPFFGKAFASIHVIATTLAKCGVPCSAANFSSTLKGLGTINVPDDALIGPLNFEKSQSGLTIAQLWTWDASKDGSKPVGETFRLVD